MSDGKDGPRGRVISLDFTVSVERRLGYRAEMVSPVTGRTLVAWSDDGPEEARNAIHALLVKEVNDSGCTMLGSWRGPGVAVWPDDGS